MFVRPKLMTLLASTALAIVPALTYGQIFTDDEFLPGSYATNGVGLQDIRFNIDYSSIDIFGDDFLTATIPEAPRSSGGAATTGAFLSANNDSQSPSAGVESFSAIMPTAVDVGNGTANEDYVLRIDVFHSSGAGVDDGSGNIDLTGTTNYTMIGINQTNTTVQINELNTGGAGTGGLTGQGFGVAVTADTGASDDYMARYGGALYVDRNLGEEPGQFYSQASNIEGVAAVQTGLLGNQLNDYWVAQDLGFEFDDTDEDPLNDLARATGNATYLAPDPNDVANYPTAVVQPLVDSLPLTTDPLHYSCGATNCLLPAGSFLVDTQTGLAPGVPTNSWSTHEVYWVDNQFTYVIDGVPVLQFTPDNDGLNGDDNIFNEFTDSGMPVLAFWDRFGGSIASSPEGANFVIFDNLEVDTATSGDVPIMIDYLADNGYLLSSETDADNDGDVDGNDFLIIQRTDPSLIPAWQEDFGTVSSTAAAVGVPEPSTAVLVIGLVVGMLARRKR